MDLAKKLVKLAKNKLGMKKMKEADITQIHHSGKKKPSKTRDVIVQFESKATRDMFHGARKKGDIQVCHEFPWIGLSLKFMRLQF